ncbi:MAG TPA: twin-arginine translocation signal domain-containing protein, partial [Syntrophaceticus sp.]|nr:twin-arginine translocation signal domain-containing protein [Syntrophaceticus sp.]
MSNDEKLKKGISRRTFIKGAVVGTAGVAAGGLLAGCGGKEQPSEKNGGATSGGADEREFIPQAYVNPQDYNYRQHTTDFKTLFSPLKIGPIEISHR